MEVENQAASSESTTDVRSTIIEAYKEYVLLNGTNPPSIFQFCKQLGITEAEFYEHFSNFEQVADAFWANVFQQVRDQLTQSEDYASFTARERFLTFYYAFFEEMKKHRSYALINLDDSLLSRMKDKGHLSEMKNQFKRWASRVLEDAMLNNEVASRSKLSDTYDSIFWWQMLFLINFWKKDRSPGFEKTDAAIEKSVNLAFDLIERNALDSAFDFGKFLFQNR